MKLIDPTMIGIGSHLGKKISRWLININRFWRWHPTIALRYLPIVDEIRKLQVDREKSCQATVLEVGSGSLGIAPYLGQKVTGVDVDFSEPTFPLLKQVKGDAADLPFTEQSFDFVVSVDMLEHVPSQKRKKVIYETLRVAKRAVFIAVPSGKAAEDQDKLLNEKYKHIFGQTYQYLAEQLKFGLPGEEEMVEMINESSRELEKKVTVKVKGNLNIGVRKFLMSGWMTDNPLVDVIFRKGFLFFIPILRYCNWEPTYRRIFFIKLKKKI